MFLSVDGTLVVQIVNLFVFILILNAVFLKPVGAAIAKRRAFIDGLSNDIEAAERDIHALRGQEEEARAAARRAAEETIAKARAEAQAEAQRIGGEFAAKAQTIVDDAHRTAAAEEATALAQEGRIVDDLARTMVERALGPGAAV